MLSSCIMNPVFINTAVVFIRLYWFEKRFQSVVLDAQQLRRTRERSKTKQENDEEKVVGSRDEHSIARGRMGVVRPSSQTIDHAKWRILREGDSSNEETNSSESKANDTGDIKAGDRNSVAEKRDETAIVDEDSEAESPAGKTPSNIPFRRDIKFADEARPARDRRESELARLPGARTADDHIDFLEKQRHREEDDVLYIPGPRDFDRGYKPQAIHFADHDDNASPTRTHTAGSDRFANLNSALSRTNDASELNGDDHVSRDSQSVRSKPAAFFEATKQKLRARRSHRASDDDDRATRESTKKSTPESLGRRGRTGTFASFLTTADEDNEMPYLSYNPTIGRNSMFVDLTEEQREELGGIEYRSLKLLAAVLCCYYVGFHVLGLISFLPWILHVGGGYRELLQQDGVNPGWWGVFTPSSMFTDLGYTVTPDSMSSFNYAVWILLIGSFLIIVGNTGFPCMLRFSIWMLSKMFPSGTATWEELRFLLDHPRRCFTLLFPSKATWWLFWVLVLLNAIDLVFFIILDLNDSTVTSLPAGIRVLDGWFQAVSTRTAGFNVVNLAMLHPAVQVSYLIMMYISVFPVAISVRRTNVYEERSLGIWGHEQDDEEGKQQSYVGAHLRRQLSFDLWFIFLGLFIIAIVEGGPLMDQTGNNESFTLFSVLFEIVSAYGTVGLSLGYPTTDASFSSQFHVLSKLVIIAMQIRGRHRGLPYALDKAILLPSENLQEKEAEEAARLAARRPTLQANGSQPDLPSARTIDRRRDGYGLSNLLSSALSAGPTQAKRTLSSGPTQSKRTD